MAYSSSLTQFPSQSVSDTKKLPRSSGKPSKWAIECIDAAESVLYFTDTTIRQTYQNKKSNYDLYRQKINKQDIAKLCNIHEFSSSTYPDSFKHIGMGNNKINLLVGEEIKRKADIRVRISSSDQEGISSKEKQMKEGIMQVLAQKIQQESVDENKLKQELVELENYYRYSWQDLKEQTCTKLLNYEIRVQDVRAKFTECFRSLLISGEPIMCIEELSNEVVVREVNPLKIFTISSSETNKIEDSDIIVEYGYYSAGQVIDDYYEYLSKEQIKKVEEGRDMSRDAFGQIKQMTSRDISFFDRYGEEPETLGIYAPSSNTSSAFSGTYDTLGNVKVTRVVWKSRRKLGELKYFDQFGKEQKDTVTEHYKQDVSKGEEIEWYYVNEWWEGTKIADDIYVKVRPVPYQGESLTNMSKGTPPYVGHFVNVNQGRVQSLMDIMKPIDYSYDIIYWKREMEIAKHKGDILAYNISMIPAGWDPEKWMKYAFERGFMPLDPTNEILKGPAQGKSAGVFNTLTATNVSSDQSRTIQMYTELLNDLEIQLGKISGISPQRESQISQHETARGIERSVLQSSHITEYWFMIHDSFKKRCLTKLLDVIKYVYKKNPIKAQYILDDMGTVIVSGFDEIAESHYDVHISNTSKDTELFEGLKQLAHAAMQTGQATLADIISLFQSDSIQQTARKLEGASDKAHQKEIEKLQEAQKIKQQELEAASQKDAADKEHETSIKILDSNTKIEVALIGSQDKALDRDINNNGINDELDSERNDILRQKAEDDIRIKQEQLKQGEEKIRQTAEKIKADIEIKKKELEIKRKQVKVQPNKK